MPLPLKPLIRAVVRRATPVAELAARHAVRFSPLRKLAERITQALDVVLSPPPKAGDFYGRAYFEATGPAREQKVSGYAGTYSRESSHADVLARLLVKHFGPSRSLDVGCARGYVVEALRELGVDAHGCDYSVYAVNTAARGARGFIVSADLLKRLPYEDRAFDVVSAFETLEHLPPTAVPHAIAELARVSRGYVIATIPSFGPNPPLPSGWFNAKVRPERFDYYRSLPESYDGPVPYDDLLRDANGAPIEGHLTIASFAWWARQFEAAGLARCRETEIAVYQALEQVKLAGFLDFYAFRHADGH